MSSQKLAHKRLKAQHEGLKRRVQRQTKALQEWFDLFNAALDRETELTEDETRALRDALYKVTTEFDLETGVIK